VSRFDWYQASVGATVPDIRACLADMVDGGSWEPQKRAPNGYQFADHLQGRDGTAARLWWGDNHVFPHVQMTGEDADLGARLLRARWPEEHAVSRVDSCIDYGEPDAYETLQGHALLVAGAHRVKVGTAGDHLLTMDGRTLYLGSASSAVRLRVYEKAAQLRAQFKDDPVKLATVPENLTRFECQVRPQSPRAKYEASKAEPMAVMGSSKWMRVLMGLVADIELEPLMVGKLWRQADDDRAYAALLSQYGGLLRRVCADLGSWECVGLQMGADLVERDKARRAS
jgi:hypothetical protein